MAELLIKANGHWMDNLSKTDIDKMTKDEKQRYEARSQKGDIIVVRPDGWKWGRCECLPDYLVVKLPNVSFEDARHYENSDIEITNKGNNKILVTKKVRKNYISATEVDKKSLEVKDFDKITPVELSAREQIKTKVK